MGKGGVVQEDIRGIVATAFDHWDSRAGDPQLHTHVVVLNRVQAVTDGAWRTLDSKALYRAAVGMSELYNGVLADELTAEELVRGRHTEADAAWQREADEWRATFGAASPPAPARD